MNRPENISDQLNIWIDDIDKHVNTLEERGFSRDQAIEIVKVAVMGQLTDVLYHAEDLFGESMAHIAHGMEETGESMQNIARCAESMADSMEEIAYGTDEDDEDFPSDAEDGNNDYVSWLK